MSETQGTQTNPYLVPVAIIIAGLFIAGAIFATQGVGGLGGGRAVVVPTGNALEATVLPVTEQDHVRGGTDPDVYLIEYSDYQCPFCTRYHATVQQILDSYEGRVAWVYRHFPLDSIHPEARPAAVASECIAELGGDEAFWSFTDTILGGDAELSRATYIAIAKNLSIDGPTFEACLDSGKYDELIQAHLTNVTELGGGGTPYTVLLTRNGDVVKFSGALPTENVTLLVERALKSLE